MVSQLTADDVDDADVRVPSRVMQRTAIWMGKDGKGSRDELLQLIQAKRKRIERLVSSFSALETRRQKALIYSEGVLGHVADYVDRLEERKNALRLHQEALMFAQEF